MIKLEVGGLFSDLGIRTPISKISVIDDILF